jgi:hypothetical protein
LCEPYIATSPLSKSGIADIARGVKLLFSSSPVSLPARVSKTCEFTLTRAPSVAE